MILPAPPLIAGASVLAGLGLAASFWPASAGAWGAAAVGLAAAALLDAWRVMRRPVPLVRRSVIGSLPVGSWTPVSLTVEWPRPGRVMVEIFDHHPAAAETQGLPARAGLSSGTLTSIVYRLRPLERGPARFGPVDLRLLSPWRMWQRRCLAGEPVTVRVLPDFRPLTRYALLAVDNRTSQLGVRLRPRRGEGLEIHHLREYRVGDTLRQIDWKATARRMRLISREYQDERNQQVVFLLDCGRTMRAVDQGEAHFEHALRSLLLLAYVALRQGDAVGLLTFAGHDMWFPPVKGRSAMRSILDALHDLKTSTEAGDYLAAAARLLTKQRRRSLVVLISNLRDDDGSEISAAMRLMARRHLVLLASLRETAIDDELNAPVSTFEQARRRAAAHHYLQARHRAHASLRGRGLRYCDVAPRDLPVALVNRYLDIKRTGAL
ncbi:MAG: DUF58 domain-containing protein [Candidatus Polarisedimenticolia bacterium]